MSDSNNNNGNNNNDDDNGNNDNYGNNKKEIKKLAKMIVKDLDQKVQGVRKRKKKADITIESWQKELKEGDCFVTKEIDFHPDKTLIGLPINTNDLIQIMNFEPYNRTYRFWCKIYPPPSTGLLMDTWRFVRFYSEALPEEGKEGTIHISLIERKLSDEAFKMRAMSDGQKAVVLVSGGLDSCVTAAIAANYNELAFLHINYGQRTESRELKAFNDIADYYKVEERLVVDIDYLRKIGGSSLTDQSIKVPENNLNFQDTDNDSQGEPNDSQNIPNTYVPFRNTNIIAIAVSWAEVIGATEIFIGAVEEDSSGYPDCRPEYFAAYNQLIKLGTRPSSNISIQTPIISLNKSQIVKKGIELKAPLNLSWSCYQSEDKACGVCDSCKLRLKGFQEAGVDDPLLYL